MTIWADRYQLNGELGQGGNGVVYRVHDLKIGRDLALKMLSAGEESLVVREAHALTALESPHILRVFNAGLFQDVPFLATDIAAMGSTEDQLVEGVGVDPTHAVRWVRQALVGLDYCHRKQVLHRDLTPGNIFLQSLDHALLGDFGIATNLDADGTAPPAGNQRCRAPEGFSGRLTSQSDIFSAGASLWRLLTGAWPYNAETEDDLAAMMRAERRPRLRDVAPHVHRSIASVVEAAISADPAGRPRTASEMAHHLARSKVHTRSWTRTESTPALTRYRSSAGGAALVVTTTRTGKQYQVETRHERSGNKVSAGCFEATRAQLGAKLRRLFDNL